MDFIVSGQVQTLFKPECIINQYQLLEPFASTLMIEWCWHLTLTTKSQGSILGGRSITLNLAALLRPKKPL